MDVIHIIFVIVLFGSLYVYVHYQAYYKMVKEEHPEITDFKELFRLTKQKYNEECERLAEIKRQEEATRREADRYKIKEGFILKVLGFFGWVLVFAPVIDLILIDVAGLRFRFTNSDFSYGIFILMLREGFRYVASLIQSMNILALKLEKLDRIDLINAKLDKLSELLEKGEVKEVPEETTAD